MGAIPKHWTANLLQIYKRNTNFQISTEPAAIACMLLADARTLWFCTELSNKLLSLQCNCAFGMTSFFSFLLTRLLKLSTWLSQKWKCAWHCGLVSWLVGFGLKCSFYCQFTFLVGWDYVDYLNWLCLFWSCNILTKLRSYVTFIHSICQFTEVLHYFYGQLTRIYRGHIILLWTADINSQHYNNKCSNKIVGQNI